MAEAKAEKQLISDIGNQLAAQKTRPNKDFLVKLLRQAASALPELKQLASLKPIIKPLSDSLLKHNLLQHKDKDIRLLVAICFCEVIRILAPNPDFSDAVFRDIFKLFLSMFVELADTTSPYFSMRVKLLETVAKLEFCVLMLDTGCEDLVLEMFRTFFSVVKEHHPQSLVSSMSSIMSLIVKEKVSESLLNVILENLLKGSKGATPSSRLAESVIQNCTEELEPFVCGFLTSCIVDRDAVRSELKEFYHEIIFEVFQCAPQMLLAVIPNLTQELLTDQVDVRIKAINLIGRLFSLPGNHIAQKYRHLFMEFLNRFSDKSVEVRLSALLCGKSFYMTNPSGTESLEVLTAIEGRLLDFDDRVRTQAVTVACDLARSKLKCVPPELISRAAERLRDKKVYVRKKALQKLLEVYQDYCTKCSGGIVTPSEHFEQIPCRILMLCYDKDCKEFRPQNMELVLAEDLFPASLSIEERTRHWVFLFSTFTPLHVKALNTILSLKRRLQNEMLVYLSLRKKEEENGPEEVQKRMRMSFVKMSASFPDPAKAEECFHKLSAIKDNGIFNALVQLLDQVTTEGAQTTRDNFLRKLGDRHPQFEFLRLLSAKCMFNIFGSEHIHSILDHLSGDRFGKKHLSDSSVKLFLTIVRAFPSLLRGLEKQFQLLLLEEIIPFNEELIQMLAKAGPYISINHSDIYPSLERVCLKGTRDESKLAVSAIAALFGTSGQVIFSELCKTLVDSLHSGQNIPTVLQSLGCMAQHSVSSFEARDREITQYIAEKVFQSTDVEMLDDLDSFDETFQCSNSCKLKIFALKALVRSFLPHQHTDVSRQINTLFDVLLQMLQKGYVSNGTVLCETDKAHIRLAAAKSVLRLSRRWDLHISPQMFRYTILIAKDRSSLIRRSFVDKTHKLLMEHAIPSRYACAFALAASDSEKDLQDDALKYMTEFIREYSKEAQMQKTASVQRGVGSYPVYIVVFLIHILAHDTGFPSEDCQDEEIYAQFFNPLVFALQALVNSIFVDGSIDAGKAISYLQSIFHAIKRAEDAIDAQITLKLHVLADFGTSIINALNRSSVSMPHSPGLVLLPSSLYKISLAEKREANLNCPNHCIFTDDFAKKMVHNFESQTFQPVRSLAKRGRKCREDSSQSDVSTFNLALGRKVNISTNRTREQSKSLYLHNKELHETLNNSSTRGKQKPALSTYPRGSVGLLSEFSVVDEDQRVYEPVIRNEQLPSCSCDSVTMKPSLAQKEDLLSSAALEENEMITKCNSVNAESNVLTTIHTDLCNSKGIGNNSEPLIGQRIKLWSPLDSCFNSGTVEGYDSRKGTHKITYDSGVIEVVSLDSEKLEWEIISDDSLLEKDSNAPPSQYCDRGELSSDCSQREMVGDASQQEENLRKKEKMNFFKRDIPLVGKEEKGQKVCVDTSASEVLNVKEDAIARRTRRRKV